MSIFDNTISFLSRALDMMNERHKLLSSNIANQETPDYKAKDINFIDELRAVQNSGGVQNIARTNPMHITGNAGLSGSGVSIINRPDSNAGYDNNSVNVELEMANMAQNSILYNASAQVISTKFRMIANAIREGR
ncbi:MAG: flagellar basal body rod protein FlgB [Nitrospirae bacterium]|nr:flagellar basal body rod protein FlgB [Nitrospirota bacterium]